MNRSLRFASLFAGLLTVLALVAVHRPAAPVGGSALIGAELAQSVGSSAATVTAPAPEGERVVKQNAIIALSELTQAYDGLPKPIRATTVPSGLKVKIAYGDQADAPILPGRYVVSATVDDPRYTGATSGILNVTITALVRHLHVLDGGIDGSVELLTGTDVTLNGSAWISGDLLVPGTPSLQLNGLPAIAGSVDQSGVTVPRNYAVTMNGQSIVRYLLRCVEPVTIQAVPAPLEPAGTRNVTLNAATDDAGNFASVRDIAVTGGTVAVPAGIYGQLSLSGRSTLVLGTPGGATPDIYNLQNLTVKAGARLRVVGPVLLILARGADVSGSLGDAAHAPLLTLAIAAGGLTLERNAAAGAYVIAPNGAVSIAGGASLTGEVIADSLTIDRDGELVEAAP